MKTLVQVQLYLLLTCALACHSLNDQRFGIEEDAHTESESKLSTSQNYPDYIPDTLYFNTVSIDSSGLVQWTLRNPANDNVKFEIQEFRWNKYMTVGKLDSIQTNSNTYSFQVDTSCGLYEIRVLAIDISEHFSKTISYPNPADIKVWTWHSKRTIPFNHKTKYEIYNDIGFIVAGGCGTEVTLDELPRGKFYINYGNEMAMFMMKYGGANVKICNTKFLVKLDSILEARKSLQEKHVAIYFRNMGSECSTNVEFSQMNNELMFKILRLETEKFIAILGVQSKKRITHDYVITELENPIHDGIDLDEVLTQIDRVTVDDTVTKKLVLEAVRSAAGKSQ